MSRHTALGYMTPAEYSASCKCTHTPVVCNINSIWINQPDSKPTLKPGGLGNGDSPGPVRPVGERLFGGELELMGMPAGLGTIFAIGSARVIVGAS